MALQIVRNFVYLPFTGGNFKYILPISMYPFLSAFSIKFKNRDSFLNITYNIRKLLIDLHNSMYPSIYSMSKWAKKKIDKIRREFLWGGNNDKGRAYNLASWSQVCISKERGRLGIPQLEEMNIALLIKW